MADDMRLVTYEVRAKEAFPKRVVLRLLRADGAPYECEIEPGVAHQLSDDLIKGEAAALRSSMLLDPEAGHARTL